MRCLRNVVDASPTVSMESGLEDRNNRGRIAKVRDEVSVSMESGLEDRNNSKPSQ